MGPDANDDPRRGVRKVRFPVQEGWYNQRSNASKIERDRQAGDGLTLTLTLLRRPGDLGLGAGAVLHPPGGEQSGSLCRQLNGHLIPVRGAPEDHGGHRLRRGADAFAGREVALLPQERRQPLRHLQGDEAFGHNAKLTSHQTRSYHSRGRHSDTRSNVGCFRAADAVQVDHDDARRDDCQNPIRT